MKSLPRRAFLGLMGMGFAIADKPKLTWASKPLAAVPRRLVDWSNMLRRLVPLGSNPTNVDVWMDDLQSISPRRSWNGVPTGKLTEHAARDVVARLWEDVTHALERPSFGTPEETIAKIEATLCSRIRIAQATEIWEAHREEKAWGRPTKVVQTTLRIAQHLTPALAGTHDPSGPQVGADFERQIENTLGAAFSRYAQSTRSQSDAWRLTTSVQAICDQVALRLGSSRWVLTR
ncbi:MAG: hypothetical protein ACKVPX_08910 [Myxococcaceae bacterium]